MSESIYKFTDYRSYLNTRLKDLGRGSSTRLAKLLGCQSGYLSRILKGESDFSTEQALSCTKFLMLDSSEKKLFMLMVQVARAGTPALKDYFNEEIKIEHHDHTVLSKRIKPTKEIGEKHKTRYYSDLAHTLVHAAHIATPPLNAADLGMSPSKFERVVENLRLMGVLETKSGTLRASQKSIHLNQGHPSLVTYHSNWRLKTIEKIQEDSTQGTHYSSAVVISKKTAAEIQELLIKNIMEIKTIVKDSEEKELHAFCLDFFPV